MFLNVISLLVGFLCLFVAVLMVFNFETNRKTNIYLLIILFVAGLQRFIDAIEVLGFVSSTFSPLKIRLSFAFFIVPVYFLFFKRLIYGKRKFNQEVVHFILPSILFSIDLFDFPLNYLIYLVFSSYYFISILVLVARLFRVKKLSLYQKKNFKTIQIWSLIMMAITFLLVVFSNYFLFSEAQSEISLHSFYRFSSPLWMGLLIYMFKNPMLIFGEYNLIKKEGKNNFNAFPIWRNKPLKSIEKNDELVYRAVYQKTDTIIFDIQNMQKTAAVVSSITLTAETLSKELKIPRRHVEFIFKYFCNYSINDFANLVKINYAVSLINEGYLNDFTVASLGEKCLFNSRYTFSKNFKKFTGYSVSDYISDATNSEFVFVK